MLPFSFFRDSVFADPADPAVGSYRFFMFTITLQVRQKFRLCRPCSGCFSCPLLPSRLVRNSVFADPAVAVFHVHYYPPGSSEIPSLPTLQWLFFMSTITLQVRQKFRLCRPCSGCFSCPLLPSRFVRNSVFADPAVAVFHVHYYPPGSSEIPSLPTLQWLFFMSTIILQVRQKFRLCRPCSGCFSCPLLPSRFVRNSVFADPAVAVLHGFSLCPYRQRLICAHPAVPSLAGLLSVQC